MDKRNQDVPLSCYYVNLSLLSREYFLSIYTKNPAPDLVMIDLVRRWRMIFRRWAPSPQAWSKAYQTRSYRALYRTFVYLYTRTCAYTRRAFTEYGVRADLETKSGIRKPAAGVATVGISKRTDSSSGKNLKLAQTLRAYVTLPVCTCIRVHTDAR